MKRQKLIFKIVEYDVENVDNVESREGIEYAAEDDILSGAEEGFLMGYTGA